MSEGARFDHENSTNVRISGHGPLRSCFGLMARISPRLTSRMAAQLFCLPVGARRRPAREERWLADATPILLPSDRRRLAGWSWGEGPTVLLHHGWAGRGAQLGAFVEPLTAAGFRVVTYDAPAHGRSPGRFTNGVELTRTLGQVVAQLGGVHAVVAHSLGCLATGRALGRSLDVARVVFISPPADMLTYTRQYAACMGLSDEVHELMLDHFVRALDMEWDEFTAEGIAAADRAQRGRQTPLLVVHDLTDAVVPLAHARRHRAAWEGARLHTTRRLGHRRILRDAGVVEEVVAFLCEGRSDAGLPNATIPLCCGDVGGRRRER